MPYLLYNRESKFNCPHPHPLCTTIYANEVSSVRSAGRIERIVVGSRFFLLESDICSQLSARHNSRIYAHGNVYIQSPRRSRFLDLMVWERRISALAPPLPDMWLHISALYLLVAPFLSFKTRESHLFPPFLPDVPPAHLQPHSQISISLAFGPSSPNYLLISNPSASLAMFPSF